MSDKAKLILMIATVIAVIIILPVRDIYLSQQPTQKNHAGCMMKEMDDKPDSMLPYAEQRCLHLKPDVGVEG